MYDNSRGDSSSSVGIAIVAVLAGIVFLGGVVGVGGAFWMYSRANQLRALEERARAEAMRVELLVVEQRAKAEAMRADSVAADSTEERREMELAPSSTEVTVHLPREMAIRLQRGIREIVTSSEGSLPLGFSDELKELEGQLQSALERED